MAEADHVCVQSLARKGLRRGRQSGSSRTAIDLVSDQRVPLGGEMDAYLVCPPSREATFNERRRRPEGTEHTVEGDGSFTTTRDHGHLFAVRWAAADARFDLPFARLRNPPDQGEIRAGEVSCRKGGGELMMCEVGLGHDHQSARILVEAVDDTWPLYAANS